MSFIEDFLKLYAETPHQAMFNLKSENADYCTHAVSNRNSYLLSGSDFNEDCYYGRWVNYCKNSVDDAYLYRSELCYECVDCENCYNCNFGQECHDSAELWFCYDCVGTTDCFGCVGLRHKRFMIFNEQYTQQNYQLEIAELRKKPLQELWRLFELQKIKAPRLCARLINTENCIGDYMTNTRNCYRCFNMTECEDCIYTNDAYQSKDLLDTSFIGDNVEIAYECFSVQKAHDVLFSQQCVNVSNLEYCFCVYNSRNCFGCVCLNRKEFHILNKPYAPELYIKKVLEIKQELWSAGQYGRFFIPSPYPESDTIVPWFE